MECQGGWDSEGSTQGRPLACQIREAGQRTSLNETESTACGWVVEKGCSELKCFAFHCGNVSIAVLCPLVLQHLAISKLTIKSNNAKSINLYSLNELLGMS